MLFKRKLFSGLLGFGLLQVVMLVAILSSASAKNYPGKSINFPLSISDTFPSGNNDSLPFPINDRRGDYISSGEKQTFDLNDPSNIKDSVAYDPNTHLYTVYEKIGNNYYRTPTTYTFDEYWQMQAHKQEVDYFQKRSNTLSLLNRGAVAPKLNVYDNLFNRLFGNGKIDITLL